MPPPCRTIIKRGTATECRRYNLALLFKNWADTECRCYTGLRQHSPYEIFTNPLSHPYGSERKFVVWEQEQTNSHRNRGPFAHAVVSPAELAPGSLAVC